MMLERSLRRVTFPGILSPMSLLRARELRVPPPEPEGQAPLPGPVDLDLYEGEIMAVTGPSGAGKTTLLRCLALLEPRAEGEILFRGKPIAPFETPAFRREVMYLAQQPPRFPMTVGETFRHPFRFKQVGTKAYYPDEAMGLCAKLDLPENVLERWTSDLSVGEAQRVSLIRGLMMKPTVLLLDEFTSALDAGSLEAAEALVSEWLSTGARAALLVSHDASQEKRLATRALRLSRTTNRGTNE